MVKAERPNGDPGGKDGQAFSETTATEFKLTSNPLLNEFAGFLADRPEGLDHIMASLIENVKNHENKTIQPNQFKGSLLELYFRSRLRHFALSHPAIQRDPISRGVVSGDYFLVRRQSNTVAYQQKEGHRNPEIVAEYDEILMVDGLPVVVEVKAAKKKGKDSFKDAFKPSKIRDKLTPLKMHFNTTTFGYMAAGLQDVAVRDTGLGSHFIGLGGLMVPLPITSAEIDLYAKKMQEHNQQYREVGGNSIR